MHSRQSGRRRKRVGSYCLRRGNSREIAKKELELDSPALLLSRCCMSPGSTPCTWIDTIRRARPGE